MPDLCKNIHKAKEKTQIRLIITYLLQLKDTIFLTFISVVILSGVLQKTNF